MSKMFILQIRCEGEAFEDEEQAAFEVRRILHDLTLEQLDPPQSVALRDYYGKHCGDAEWYDDDDQEIVTADRLSIMTIKRIYHAMRAASKR